MGKKKYTVQGFYKNNALFQPNLYVNFLIQSLGLMLINLSLYFSWIKLYSYTN